MGQTYLSLYLAITNCSIVLIEKLLQILLQLHQSALTSQLTPNILQKPTPNPRHRQKMTIFLQCSVSLQTGADFKYRQKMSIKYQQLINASNTNNFQQKKDQLGYQSTVGLPSSNNLKKTSIVMSNQPKSNPSKRHK